MYDDRRPAASRARQPIFTAPGVLLYLIGAFVFMFVALTFTPALTLGLFGPALELRPAQFVAGPAANDGVVLMIAPLVGHMFVHADLIHLGSNSVWLLAFGAPVFRRLEARGRAGPAALGPWRAPPPPDRAPGRATIVFLTFFFLSGVVGALSHIAFHAREFIPLVGASGGVSGLLGALVRFGFRRPPVFSRGPHSLAPLTDPAVVIWTLVIVALNVGVGLFGFGVAGEGVSVAWLAHLGGYFFGLLAFPAFDRLSGAPDVEADWPARR